MRDYLLTASEQLLKDGFGPNAVMTALETVGRGLNIDRVYVFEDSTDPKTGERLTNQRYEWSADGVEAQLDNPELQGVPYAMMAPEWPAVLDRGEVIMGNVRDMEPRVRGLLESQGIKSILVCPITFGGQCWGFVGFDDCQREREWPSDEVLALRSLARSLTAALRHTTMRASLDQAREQLRSILGA